MVVRITGLVVSIFFHLALLLMANDVAAQESPNLPSHALWDQLDASSKIAVEKTYQDILNNLKAYAEVIDRKIGELPAGEIRTEAMSYSNSIRALQQSAGYFFQDPLSQSSFPVKKITKKLKATDKEAIVLFVTEFHAHVQREGERMIAELGQAASIHETHRQKKATLIRRSVIAAGAAACAAGLYSLAKYLF